MKLKKRNFLSNKEKKKLYDELSSTFGDKALQLFNKNDKLESAVSDKGEKLILKKGRIWFFYYNNNLYPTIRCLRGTKIDISSAVVDIGAIKFILNGADVMAPGVDSFGSGIKEGDFITIKEEKAKSIIAVGLSLINSEDFDKGKKGKIIKNLHSLKDEYWNFQIE
ncbi:MAG: DUF1947 domain-containing protein [Candidatus Heimdallarchaeaceae archaeon]